MSWEQYIDKQEKKGVTTLHSMLNFLDRESKIRVPVDTGLLFSDINTVQDGLVGAYGVGKDAYYGGFQEKGFRHYITGEFIQNPYLLPALEENEQRLFDIFKKGMQ